MAFGELIRRFAAHRRDPDQLVRRHYLSPPLVIERLETRLCPVLTLTTAAVDAGFKISTFATDFLMSAGGGPLGIAFPDSGGILVTDGPGGVHQFPIDADGQSALSFPAHSAQSYGDLNALDLAKLGANIYMSQTTLGRVVQINDNGTINRRIANLQYAGGMVADPLTGHLFVDDFSSGHLYEVDPQAPAVTRTVNSDYLDGLALSADGQILYAADKTNNHVISYDTGTMRKTDDLGLISDVPDGITFGTGLFAGHLYVDTNGGRIVDLDTATHAQTVIADQGSRGDFVRPDPNDGSLLVTQSDRIIRLKFPTGPAASFRMSAPASSVAGEPFGVTVTALDSFGAFATGYTGTVHFDTSDSHPGLLPSDYAFTQNDNGTHTFGAVLFTAGAQTITVQDTANSSITANATIVVSAASASQLHLTAPSTAVAGTSFDLTVAALDAYSNPVTSYSGTVDFTDHSDPHAVLPTDYTFTAGDNGTHTFSNGATLFTPGTQTVTVTDTVAGMTGNATIAVTSSVSAADRFVLRAPLTAKAGSPFDVTVTAVDSNGNVVPSYTGTVSFSSMDPYHAVVPDNYTFTSSDQGVHSFAGGVTLFTAGPQTLTVQDTTTSSITDTVTITVMASAATHLLLAAPPAAIAGKPFDVTITALDPYGNVDTAYAGTVTLTSSDRNPQPLDYTFSVNDSGTHTFTMRLYSAAAQTISAWDAANGSSHYTRPIAIVAAPASQFLITAPSTVNAGVPFDVIVTALDPFGNTDTNYQGTVDFTSTDPQMTRPNDYTFASSDQGIHTFAGGFTLVTAGPQTLTATDTANAAITGSAPVTVQMGGGASGPGGPISSPVVEPIAPVAASGNVQPIQPLAAVDRLFASLIGKEPAFPPAWHPKHGPLPELFGTTPALVA